MRVLLDIGWDTLPGKNLFRVLACCPLWTAFLPGCPTLSPLLISHPFIKKREGRALKRPDFAVTQTKVHLQLHCLLGV